MTDATSSQDAGGLTEIIHAKLRGVIGAMAMTGVRVFAIHAGVIREDPPGRLVRMRKGRHPRWVVELVHWSIGGVLGVVYGMLPEAVRRRAWSGPLYGLLAWIGFDAVVAPALGLERNWPQGRERAVFVADHLLYGFVLNEMRERPPRMTAAHARARR